jgi:cupin superfamily acireductone dioxygenase involved in methionine salvage
MEYKQMLKETIPNVYRGQVSHKNDPDFIYHQMRKQAHATEPSVIAVNSLAKALVKNGDYKLLFSVSKTHNLGLTRVENLEGLYERHNSHEEILFVLAGIAEFICTNSEGLEVKRAVKEGDLLVIPKGWKHTGKVTRPLVLLFLTPTKNNEFWDEKNNAFA